MRPNPNRVLVLAALSLAHLPGCGGPTPTPGTQGVPPERLAVVHVRQHGTGLHEWRGDAVHVDAFYVGGVEHRVTGDQDFTVSPGRHTFMVNYGRCVHGLRKPAALDEDGIFAGPYGRFEADIAPGTEYELTGDAVLTGGSAVETRHGLREVRGEKEKQGARSK